MTLGDFIKEYRNAHQCSMDDFARLSGLSKAYISILERNYNPSTKRAAVPSLDTIKRVANAISMDVNELITALDADQEVSLEPEKKDMLLLDWEEKPLISEGLSLDGMTETQRLIIEAILKMPVDRQRALAEILGLSE